VSCYYVNQKLEFFGIASAQVSRTFKSLNWDLGLQTMASGVPVSYLFIILNFVVFSCASYLFSIISLAGNVSIELF